VVGARGGAAPPWPRQCAPRQFSARLRAPCRVSASPHGWSDTPLGTSYATTSSAVSGKAAAKPARTALTLTGFLLPTATTSGAFATSAVATADSSTAAAAASASAAAASAAAAAA